MDLQPDGVSMPKRKQQRRFTEEQKAKIIAEYKAAAKERKARQVCQRWKVHPGLVNYWFNRPTKSDRGPSPRIHSPEYRQRILDEISEGKTTTKALAIREGLHTSVIQRWKRDAGIRMIRKRRDLVAVTQAALTTMHGSNGRAAAGASLKEAILTLRSMGVEVEGISVQGNSCTISYITRETFEL